MATYSGQSFSSKQQPFSSPKGSGYTYVAPKITTPVASYNSVPNTLSAANKGAATAQATNIAPIASAISSRSSGGSSNAQISSAIPSTSPTVVTPLKTSTVGITYNASQPYTPIAKTPTLNVGANQNSTIDAAAFSTTGDMFTYDANTKTYIPVQKTDIEKEQEKALRDYKMLKGELPNSQDIYNSSGVQEVNQARQQVNNLTAQINAITSKAQADQLSVIGQGRGIPEVIIGGQQAQISREAAIQALPLQALLASAQGNLELAQQHLDTTFKLRLEDATNAFNYQKDLAKYALDVADKKQALAIAKLEKQDDRNFALLKDTINYGQTLASEAIKNGQPQIAAKIGQLDHNSPTYSQDLAQLAGQIQQKTTSSTSTNLTPTDKQYLISSGLTDSEINLIQSDISKYGIEKAIEGITNQNQKTAIRVAYGGKDNSQFLTKDYFTSLFTEDQLMKAAEDAGFRGILTSWATEKDKYLTYLESTVNAYRTAGYTDKEILNLMK